MQTGVPSAESFAAQAREYKEKSGLSIPQIAARTRYPYRTLQDWFRGIRTPKPYGQKEVLRRLKSLSPKKSLVKAGEVRQIVNQPDVQIGFNHKE